MPDLVLRDVVKSYGEKPILDGLDLEVHDEEFVTLLGPSGCGKTTTLMAIAGFQHPDSGHISCGDDVFFDSATHRKVAAERRNLGIVFQSYAIWPHMTVVANVAFPLRLRKVRKAEATRRARDMLELVELGELGDRYPHQLSGGQQQRVALARALSFSPSVLLLDEPFSNLDAKLRERAREWVKNLQREIGITTLFVTHDQDEALSMSDRIMVMDQGRILQVGPPEEIYRRPASRFVADFVGRCNFLSGTVAGRTCTGQLLVTVEGVGHPLAVSSSRRTATGSTVTLALRPESFRVARASGPPTSTAGAPGPTSTAAGPGPTTGTAAGPGPATCTAVITSESFLGDHYLYRMALGPNEILVQSDMRLTEPVAELAIETADIAVVE
jgi:iron(III) transport system ATP-binding protein